MKLINTIKRFLHNQSHAVQISAEIREGIANQSALLNRKLTELNETVRYLSNVISHQEAGSGVYQLASTMLTTVIRRHQYVGWYKLALLRGIRRLKRHCAHIPCYLHVKPTTLAILIMM